MARAHDEYTACYITDKHVLRQYQPYVYILGLHLKRERDVSAGLIGVLLCAGLWDQAPPYCAVSRDCRQLHLTLAFPTYVLRGHFFDSEMVRVTFDIGDT